MVAIIGRYVSWLYFTNWFNSLYVIWRKILILTPIELSFLSWIYESLDKFIWIQFWHDMNFWGKVGDNSTSRKYNFSFNLYLRAIVMPPNVEIFKLKQQKILQKLKLSFVLKLSFHRS